MSAILTKLAFLWTLPFVVDGKAKKPSAGSAKCEKGAFKSLAKDAAIPLCDAHFPDEKAKSDWLVLFYKKEMEGVEEVLNRVAMDLGNEPPEKSKNLKKAPKKQRTRIKDLADKYEFEAHIPKKGLEEKGKEPLLKVGAVCCDCGEPQKVCENRDTGIRLIRNGFAEKAMPGGAEGISSADTIVKFLMGELGFIKGHEGATPGGEMTEEDLLKKIEDLTAQKKKASAEEDFDIAASLKEEIEILKKKLPKKETKESLTKQVEDLTATKKQAVADEDFQLAKQLKKQIDDLQAKLAKTEL